LLPVGVDWKANRDFCDSEDERNYHVEHLFPQSTSTAPHLT
jgi:hypothetical protein